MGERLVVSFKRNDEPFAAIYFHWSAYSIPATFILMELSKHCLPRMIEADNDLAQLELIRFAEKMYECGYNDDSEQFNAEMTLKRNIIEIAPVEIKEILESIFDSHGGLCGADQELAAKKWPNEQFFDDVNRNQGLVAISSEEIERMIDCAQMVTEIDLDNLKVLNGTVYPYSLSEYMEETVEDDDFIFPDDLQRSPIDLNQFNIDDIECAYEMLLSSQNGWLRHNDTCYLIRYT